MSGRYDQKKNAKRPDKPDQEQEQDQEQEVDQEKKQESTRAQAQMGNAALAAMLNNRGLEGFSGEGGGGAQSVRRRKDPEHGDLDYGGDDDFVDDAPLSLEDLTRSWNPTTTKSEDRPRFVEPMPDDDLPPEDSEWLAAARAHPSDGPLPRITTIDALLQPSPEVVAASISGWSRATARWAAMTPGFRALGWLVGSGAPLLQSPDARVLPARATVGALGTCLLAESPAVLARPTIETGAVIEFCLELEGRAHRVDNLVSELADAAAKLPRARTLLAARLPSTGGHVDPVALPQPVAVALGTSLRTLVRWPSLEDPLEPLSSAPAPQDDPDDPLGIDAVLAELTGGAVDPNDGVYARALQTAERLAGEASRTRIAWVAVATLVDDVARLWTRSLAPVLHTSAQRLDHDIDQSLKLLLEVARACQKRSFEPRAIGNGLRRAARQLDEIRQANLDHLAALIGGILPGLPQLPPREVSPDDALARAQAISDATEAVQWADALPSTLDAELARCALLVVSGADAATLLGPLAALRTRALEGVPSPITTVATILLAHAHLRLEHYTECLELAEAIRVVGRARRNGLLVAEGAVLAIEAHLARDEPQRAAAVRLQAGRLCIDLDARGGLSLLARWTPPLDDDEDYAPLFDYPMDGDEPAADDDAPDHGS